MSDMAYLVTLIVFAGLGAGFVGSFIGDLIMAFLRIKGWWPMRKITVIHVIEDKREGDDV